MESPKDRAARNEALVRIGQRVAVALVVWLAGGGVAWALGVPFWIVLAAGVVVLVLLLTTA